MNVEVMGYQDGRAGLSDWSDMVRPEDAAQYRQGYERGVRGLRVWQREAEKNRRQYEAGGAR